MRALRATYRLQLTPEFGFEAVRELVPYLERLGVSHLYLSPSLQARAGSAHGYDVVDPSRLSDALGGRAAFTALVATAFEHGLGVVLDVVPNHMAADDANRYWADPELREVFFDLDHADPERLRWRRFFDIDELAAVRVERDEVFEATHGFVLSLVAAGLVDGLRVDHPDGLADPAGYLQRLRDEGVARVWVEKILDPDEPLRDWPVCGTVGYEFLNDVAALFVDPAAEGPLTALWEEVSGDARDFGAWAQDAKREQLDGTLRPELERLGRELGAEGGDLAALAQALCALPVYRTYVEPWSGRVEEADRAALHGVDPRFAPLLLLEREAPAAFVTRFQQTTPAVMAKGVEDTAFYRYGRLLALNDVGGDPGRFGISVERFHAGNAERARRFPEGLLTTMTHDAKRSADVRARIGALSECAEEWAALARRLLAGPCARLAAGPDGPPDAIEQYFLLQTLAGAWPIEPDRLEGYVEKALREGKRNTNWVAPDAAWERPVLDFVRALVADAEFAGAFEPFARRLAAAGERSALGQLVLKLTCPGVPDIYQGDELPFIALVDPDNRRPVDWERRRRLLDGLSEGAPPTAETRKLSVIQALLALRARRPDAFGAGPTGRYVALEAPPGVIAFARGEGVVVAVAIRAGGDLAAVRAAHPETDGWVDVLAGDPAACVLAR